MKKEYQVDAFAPANAAKTIAVWFSCGAASAVAGPRSYEQGYPNANCKGCPKATSPTYWNHTRRIDPLVFKARAELSRELGAKLVRVNNQRIYLDELDPNAVGKPMKNMDFECGIFCEQKGASE